MPNQTKEFVPVGLTVEARAALRDAALSAVSPLGRKVSYSDAVMAALVVIASHRDEFLDALRNS